jgi:hypothetical protein
VAYSPAFIAELRKLRPERPQKFICGVAEFELLVQLGIRGWGVRVVRPSSGPVGWLTICAGRYVLVVPEET